MKHWNEKVVVVTGGSKGLGRAIALAFAKAGAQVVIMARDAERLAEAKEYLESQFSDSVRADSIVCDVTDDSSVDGAVQQVLERFGAINVWVNNVGLSCRTRLVDATVEQFSQLMEMNFLTAVRCTKAALPHLTESGGHVVNIGSLSSKTAWPNVAPYTTSKHALAAYTAQLRLEGPKQVHYLLVCPGPIQRDDAGSRYDDQAKGLSESARKPGAGAPVKGLDPDALAEKIVAACERRRNELIVPFKSRILFWVSSLSTRMGDALLRRLSRSSE